MIKRRVGFLFAMIGVGVARDLAAGQAASVGEGGQKNSVDSTLLLKNIEHRLDPFVHERNRAGLDADHFWGGGLLAGGGRKKRRRNGYGRGGRGGGLDKFPARQLGEDSLVFMLCTYDCSPLKAEKRTAVEAFLTLPAGGLRFYLTRKKWPFVRADDTRAESASSRRTSGGDRKSWP